MNVHCLHCGASFPIYEDMPYQVDNRIFVNCETCSIPIPLEIMPTVKKLLREVEELKEGV